MSWLYSQALVEEYSADTSLDGAPCALWNGTHTQRASWLPAKMTDACRLSRSGMTFKPLTDDLGEGVLMSFLGAFLVRTLAVQERELASTESEAACGDTWRELSVKFDPDSSSWKTHLCLFQEDLPESSVTLPKWGMMRDGVLWERTTSPLPTKGTGSGFSLPTPTCADATMGAILNENTKFITLKSGRLRKISNQGVSGSIGLARTVAMWQDHDWEDAINQNDSELDTLDYRIKETEPGLWRTPIACEWKDMSCSSQVYLQDQVKMWPTPVARDWKDSINQNDRGVGSRDDSKLPVRVFREEPNGATGQLNPTWVELLMGWPKDWTDIEQPCDGHIRGWVDNEWEEGVPRVAIGVKHRIDRLKAIGNGQVPAVAALAWEILTEPNHQPVTR